MQREHAVLVGLVGVRTLWSKGRSCPFLLVPVLAGLVEGGRARRWPVC